MQFNVDERGKIFVGGLSWDTTHSSMLRYFSRYGDVIDCVVMKNQVTGKSRGFGFVTFRDPSLVDSVLALEPHILDGRQIDPKSCNPRSMNKGGKSAENSRKKIFIGGLPISISEEQLREQFSAYGNITEIVIMYDQQKHKSRGFGFLTFENEESVDRVIEEHFIHVSGKQVEVKRAEPRDMKTIADTSPSSSFIGHCAQSISSNQHSGALGQVMALTSQIAATGSGQVIAVANHSMMAAGGSLPIGYSAIAPPFTHSAATLGLGEQCMGGLPIMAAHPLNSLYPPSWLPCPGGPESLATPGGLGGGGGVQSTQPQRIQTQLASVPFNAVLSGQDGVTRMYTLSTVGHCSTGGFPSITQYGMMEGGDGDAINKPMMSASATSYHHFAFSDYGFGVCSLVAPGGCGDSVHMGFLDPMGSQGRIAACHSMASQAFHPYKR